MTGHAAPVVVGVDGSRDALHAVELAARLAAERGRTLRVVHAFVWPSHPAGGADGEAEAAGFGATGGPDEGLAARADRVVAEAAARAHAVEPGLPVDCAVVIGAAPRVLLDEAGSSALTVVGSRGRGGFAGLLLGSVGLQLATHATRPVVVARGDLNRDGDVVAGVDGSPGGSAAVGYAFEQASLSGRALTLLHAYRYPMAGEPGDMLPLVYDADELADEEAVVLAEAVAGWRERYPDVPTRSLVVRDRPARALVHASERARLVVVGSRGRGGFTGLLLGSVTHAVLQHASCPVAIIH